MKRYVSLLNSFGKLSEEEKSRLTRTQRILESKIEFRRLFFGWWEDYCSDCDSLLRKENLPKKCPTSGKRPRRLWRCIAPDITLDENLHYALQIADIINEGPVSLSWSGKCWETRIKKTTYRDKSRITVLLFAIEHALGIRN